MRKALTQNRFNYLNLSIAVVALLISIPSVVNQIRQYFYDNERNSKTMVVYYSTPRQSTSVYSKADKCWGSLLSVRFDSYRCISSNSILDPCFWVEEYGASEKSYFSCPKSEMMSGDNSYIYVDESQVERSHIQDSRTINLSSDLPWLIYIDDTRCWLSSGAVGIAYGDKGNIYSCESDKYLSVTTGEVKENKHYFECRYRNENVFKECFAKKVVY